MIFSKSIAFDEEDLGVATATQFSDAQTSADTVFLEKLRSGNAEAFDTLVTRYSGDVYALLYRLTADANEAQDLTQETFLSALKSIKSFRGDASLKTWLGRIAVNHSRNRFRWWNRRKRNQTVSLDETIGDSDVPLSDTISANVVSPEASIMQRQREDALVKALNDLPDIFREVIVLCDVEGLSYDEISSTLEINIGTVKSRIARGRSELRQRLMDF